MLQKFLQYKHQRGEEERCDTEGRHTPRRRGSAGAHLKRRFVGGGNAGLAAPSPSWSLSGGRGASCAALSNEAHRGSVSARRLAAFLWELQDVRFFWGTPQEAKHSLCDALSVGSQILHEQHASPASRCFKHGTPPIRIPFQRRNVDRRKQHGRTNQAQLSEEWKRCAAYDNVHADVESKAFNTQHDSSRRATNRNGLTKLLNHINSLEQLQSSTMSLVAVLHLEVEKTHARLQELKSKDSANLKKMKEMTWKYTMEKNKWREQEEDHIGLAVLSIMQELEDERTSNQKLESLHKRASRDLHEVKKTLSRALKELDKERKAHKLMEDVCDKLSREVGEDKARLEELKCESIKVTEEAEEERRRLHIEELWREEHVQMQLMEVKLELEEKNTAVEKLGAELKSLIQAQRADHLKGEDSSEGEDSIVIEDAGHNKSWVVPAIGWNLQDSFHSKRPCLQGESRPDVMKTVVCLRVESPRSGRSSSFSVLGWDKDQSGYVDLHTTDVIDWKP